ncbi:condensation domain-containing protein [Streptomyces sp. M19]
MPGAGRAARTRRRLPGLDGPAGAAGPPRRPWLRGLRDQRRGGGRLVPGALERAVAHVLAQHPYLRSRFDLSSFAEPVQLVPKALPRLPVEVLDRCADPAREESREESRGQGRAGGREESRAESFAAWMLRERKRHFDLDHGPLVRFTAHDHGPEFRLTVSSFALDGWCTALVLTELLSAYRAALRGRPIAPPRCARATRTSSGWNAPPSAHRSTAPSGPRNCAVPNRARCRPRPPVPGRRRTAGVPAAHRRGDRRRGTRRPRRTRGRTGVGLKHVLLGVHLRIVRSLTGRTDLVTGLETNGRPERADGDRAVGVFNNIVPLRAPVPAAASWAQLASTAHAAETRISPYRRYPLVTLNREFDASSLFDTLFVFTHFHLYSDLSARAARGVRPPGARPDVRAADRPLQRRRGVRPAAAAAGGRPGRGPRRTGGGDRPVVPRRVGERRAGAAPSRRRVPPAAARTTCRTSGAAGESVPDLIEDAVRRGPDRIALYEGNRHVSYRVLWQRAGRLAAMLQARSVGPETVVGLWADRDVDCVIGLLAVLRAGAAYLPVDAETRRARCPPCSPRRARRSRCCHPGHPCPPGRSPDDPADRRHRRRQRWRCRRADTATAPATAAGAPRLRPGHLRFHRAAEAGRRPAPGPGHLPELVRPRVRHHRPHLSPVHSSLAFDLSVTALLAPLAAGARRTCCLARTRPGWARHWPSATTPC